MNGSSIRTQTCNRKESPAPLRGWSAYNVVRSSRGQLAQASRTAARIQGSCPPCEPLLPRILAYDNTKGSTCGGMELQGDDHWAAQLPPYSFSSSS